LKWPKADNPGAPATALEAGCSESNDDADPDAEALPRSYNADPLPLPPLAVLANPPVKGATVVPIADWGARVLEAGADEAEDNEGNDDAEAELADRKVNGCECGGWVVFEEVLACSPNMVTRCLPSLSTLMQLFGTKNSQNVAIHQFLLLLYHFAIYCNINDKVN
jgi:hypothetical protein